MPRKVAQYHKNADAWQVCASLSASALSPARIAFASSWHFAFHLPGSDVGDDCGVVSVTAAAGQGTMPEGAGAGGPLVGPQGNCMSV